MPQGIERVLDVGCGTGGTAAPLRAKGVKEIVGIEIEEQAARKAETRFDSVILGDVEQVSASLPQGYFDLILYADILEHLVEPWSIIASHRRLLRPQGYILLSAPNVRHWRLLRDLVIRGRWVYQDTGGTLDRGHLRFFTRKELLTMVKEAGFQPLVEGHNEFNSLFRLIDIVSLGKLRGFLAWQHYLLARNSVKDQNIV
jgi:2-polyprenyl-3-methyl-5-hydroxy-6-metoxy-1,4-benzoquinol methylase